MTLQAFRSIRFTAATRLMIDRANTIIGEYSQRLTVRQLYYQFVSRGWLANTARNYANLAARVTDARYAGEVSWDALEDRGRTPQTPSDWPSIKHLVDDATAAFRLPRWDGQDNYVELWVEKQALAGVLWPIASKWHVTLMVNKGYSSASAMKESADRFIEACGIEADDMATTAARLTEEGWNLEEDAAADELALYQSRQPHLLYLGDHDPSGEDMVRDVRDRLREMGVWSIKVEKLGLTMAQIQRFRPPPNPAKLTDSRAADYIAKHGTKSWELDALPPRELNRLADQGIAALCDTKKMDAVIAREKAERDALRKAMANIGKRKR